jgi:hypothetical protein
MSPFAMVLELLLFVKQQASVKGTGGSVNERKLSALCYTNVPSHARIVSKVLDAVYLR